MTTFVGRLFLDLAQLVTPVARAQAGGEVDESHCQPYKHCMASCQKSGGLEWTFTTP